MVNPVVKEFNQKHYQPLKVFKVKSRTNRNPDTSELETYSVELWEDRNIYCDCMWGKFGKKKNPCWHAYNIQEKLEKEFGSVENAIKHYRDEK